MSAIAANRVTKPNVQLLISLIWMCGSVAGASACPVCDTSTAAEIRAGLVDDYTALTIAAVVAPFAVVAGVATVVHFGVPRFGRRP